MVDVIHFRHFVPFHQLPTCVVGTSRVPFLQLGVCQGLVTSRSGQDSAERHLGTGKQSWSRLLQSAVPGTEGRVSSLSSYVTLTKFKRETVSSILGTIRKGVLHVLDWPQGHSFRFSTLSLDCTRGESLPVQGSPFWPFYSSSGLPQGVCFGIRVVSQEGNSDPLLYCMDDWLVIAESIPLLLQHHKQLLQLYKDLGIVINMEKSDLELFSSAPYLGMLTMTGTIWERVFPTNSRIVIFWDLADKFLHPSSPPTKMWQQFGMLCSQGWDQGLPPSLAAGITLVSSIGQSSKTSASFRGLQAVYRVVATGGEMGTRSPLQVPLFLFMSSPC